jgi:hypothetical protein
MEDLMSNAEFITVTIDQYSTLWRVKCAQPERVENLTLDKELKILEIKLHAMGVNTGDIKM